MDVVTSIVSISDLDYSELLMSTFSIGMVFTSIPSTHVDGASFVNQCPIIPGDMFRYQFEVPDQAVRYERTVVS